MPAHFDWLVIPDMQVPFHDKAAVQALIDHVKWRRPDGLLCVGDEIDLPSVGRWNKGLAGEYESNLGDHAKTVAEIMRAFRKALGRGKPFHVSRSNHGDRVLNYVAKNAPALRHTVQPGGALDIPVLCHYGDKDIDITYHRKPFEFAPGWVLCHGDEGGLSPLAGRTAANLAEKKFGKNVVSGHTHRLGVASHTTMLNGQVTRTITGMEVGHLMDLRQVDYLGGGSGNWQQGFGEVLVRGKHVTPIAHPIHPGGVILRPGRRAA